MFEEYPWSKLNAQIACRVVNGAVPVGQNTNAMPMTLLGGMGYTHAFNGKAGCHYLPPP